MMARASANCTSEARERWRLRRIGDPTVSSPARVQRSIKQPGSKELVLGKWVEVTEDA
jgi:hypothetical protein